VQEAAGPRDSCLRYSETCKIAFQFPLTFKDYKLNLHYMSNQFVPRSKRLHHGYKTNQVMLYKAKVAVCSEIPTKDSTQSDYHIEFLNIKPGGT
jgi:hypothetical protein